MLFARLTKLLTAGAVAFALMATAASAQQVRTDGDVLRIGVINLQKINREATVFESIRTQIESYGQRLQTAIQAEEDELRKADRELARQRTILSPEAYAAERQKFEKRIVDFQRTGQKRKQELDAARTQALIEANNIVRNVVNEFAAKNELTIILRADLMAYYAKGLDITDIILERLNATAQTIKVPQPKE